MSTRLFIIISFTFFAFASQHVAAQAVSDKKAEAMIYTGNIIGASKAFETKVQSEPNNPDYRLKLGYCYLNMPNNKHEAETHLKKAYELYQTQENERSAFDAKYQLAIAYRKNLRFGEALVLFNELIIESDRKDYEAVDILKKEIDYCESAKELLNAESPLKVKNMSEPVNSVFSEHSPFLTYNEKIMFFTSRRDYENSEQSLDGQYDEDIYMTEKRADGGRTVPERLGNRINTRQNDANCGLSADGTKIYIYRDGDIYKSEKGGNRWTRIAKLGNYVNTSHREIHLFVNKDGNTIFFSSDMPGGYGGADIYRIKKQGNNKWTKPENLGPVINTPYDDDSPFLHENGTFYFSSNGHNSIGGFDIFSADMNGQSFSNVQNLGFPVNSVEDDIHYFLSNDTERAYFASKRKGGYGRSDIYFIDFTDTADYYVRVQGKILLPPEARKNQKATITVYKETTKALYKTVSADTSGAFSVLSRRGESYIAHAEAEGMYFDVFGYPAPLSNDASYTLSERRLKPIDPALVNKKYLLIFEENKTKLDNASELLLDITADFLKNHPDFQLDLTAADKADKQKSRGRNRVVMRYLADKGIPESRINVDLESFEAGEKNQVMMTIIDDRMKEYLASGEVINTDDPAMADISGENKEAPAGENGVFAIELGEHDSKTGDESIFISRFQGRIKQTVNTEGEEIHIFGRYTQRSLAEDNLEMIQKMGFPNAKVIKIAD